MLVSVETTASRLTAKPGLVRSTAARLRIRSAATMSSSAVTAICPATRPSPSVQPREADASPRKSAAMSRFEACTPGARPASSAAITATASVNASTRPSTRRSKVSGSGSGRLIEAAIDATHHARSKAAAAPAADSTIASVRSCRTSRPRLAPIASRMPISFCRLDARASSMLATLAHAISSTRPTTVISAAAIDTTIGSLAGWKCTSLVARSERWRPLLVIGFSASMRAITTARLARACSIVARGFRRPRMKSQRSARRSSRVVPVGDGIASCIPTGSTSSDADTGIHSSGESTGTMPLKVRGATPTIVYALPRIRTTRPTTSGADSSSRVQ